MVEKRPEFTGPLVNSWPGRLLTLEIARPPKKGVQKLCLRPSCIKKTPPPPGPLINSSFWSHQKIRGKIAFSDFRVFVFWPLFFCFWFCSPRKNNPQNLCHSFGVAKKQGKIRFFFACLVADFLGGGVFPCGVLMLVFLFMRTFFVANV